MPAVAAPELLRSPRSPSRSTRRAAAGARPVRSPCRSTAHDTWTSDSGLPQNSITAILQTPRRVPVARDAGRPRPLRRRPLHDLRHAQHAGALATTGCRRCSQTRDGTLWIGTVTRPRPHARRRVRDAPGRRPRPRRRSARSSRTRDGAIWVASNLGATRIRGDRVTDLHRLRRACPGPWSGRSARTARGALWVGGSGARRDSTASGSCRGPWPTAFPAPRCAILPDPDGGTVGRHGARTRARRRAADDAVRRRHRAHDQRPGPRAPPRPRREPLARHRRRPLPLPRRPLPAPRRAPTASRATASSPWPRTARAASGSARRTAGSIASRPSARPSTPTRDGLSDDKPLGGPRGQPGQSLDRHRRRRPEPPAAPARTASSAFAVLGATIQAIAEGPDGALWIGTRGGPASSASRAGAQKRYTTTDGLVRQLDLVGSRRPPGASSGPGRWPRA